MCPVTGLPVIRKPEWTDVQLDDNYRTTVEVIGRHIVHSIPHGQATLQYSALEPLRPEVSPSAAWACAVEPARERLLQFRHENADVAELQSQFAAALAPGPQRSLLGIPATIAFHGFLVAERIGGDVQNGVVVIAHRQGGEHIDRVVLGQVLDPAEKLGLLGIPFALVTSNTRGFFAALRG